jgi:hypothetical protein
MSDNEHAELGKQQGLKTFESCGTGRMEALRRRSSKIPEVVCELFEKHR